MPDPTAPPVGSGPTRIVVIGVDPGPGGKPGAGRGCDLGELVGSDPAGGLVVAGRRLLAALDPPPPRSVTLGGDLHASLEAIAAETGTVWVLASGDPGYFGILRALATRFDRSLLEVHPAVSSVALAFARVALPWDDAVVVSAHGRPLAEAVDVLVGGGPPGSPGRATGGTPATGGGSDAGSPRRSGPAKAAVLVSPDNPPEAVATALVERGTPPDWRTVVCSRLGYPDETVTDTDLAGVASGRWDPLSVVLLLAPDPVAPAPPLAAPPGAAHRERHSATTARSRSAVFGRAEDDFDHRAGMVTKPEVRAAALAHLRLPASGVLWDVGAGSGSVAVEAAGLAPGLSVIAVERDRAAAAQVAANASRHGVEVRVVHGEAPAALAGLADPDRVFVGGGGLGVLDAVVERLLPGGRVVAAFAALERAAAAAERLGNLVEMSVARGVRLPGGGHRLEAANPVFLAWGPGSPTR